MTSKTIALSGAEIKAEYSGGSNAWLRNDSADTIYASAAANITAGADGVVSIPAGQSAPIYGANGTVYLLGTGSVQLIGSDYSTSPFKASATSGGSGADNVARAAISTHAGNTEIHVTTADKSAWNAKAEMSDIPTTLPADGGNADTVDGKHASDFAAASNPVISGTMSLTRSNTTTSNQIFAYQNALRLRCSDPNAADKTYYDIIISPTGLYKEGYSNGTLISKGNLIDGGNADTVDGKRASDFSQIINLSTPTDTKTAIGIQYKTTTYWCQAWTDYPAGLKDGQGVIIAVNYKSTSDGNIWCRQIYISPQSNTKIYQRIISGTDIGEWINIADGGNAASVGVYTEEKLAELEARIAALEGGTT